MANVGISISEAENYYKQGLETVRKYNNSRDKVLLTTALVNFNRANNGFQKLSPNPWIAIANCKVLRDDHGDVESAISDLETAIRIEEIAKRNNPKALLSLKLALERMGVKIESIKSYDEAHLCLGKFYCERPQPNYERAKYHLEKASNSEIIEIRLNAGNLLATNNLISLF